MEASAQSNSILRETHDLDNVRDGERQLIPKDLHRVGISGPSIHCAPPSAMGDRESASRGPRVIARAMRDDTLFRSGDISSMSN